jgi:hypothetical protein
MMSGLGNESGHIVRRPIAEWVSRPEALHAALMLRNDAEVRFRNGERLLSASLVAGRPIHRQNGGARRSNATDAGCCGVPTLCVSPGVL